MAVFLSKKSLLPNNTNVHVYVIILQFGKRGHMKFCRNNPDSIDMSHVWSYPSFSLINFLNWIKLELNGFRPFGNILVWSLGVKGPSKISPTSFEKVHPNYVAY